MGSNGLKGNGIPDYNPYGQLEALKEFVKALLKRSSDKNLDIELNRISGVYSSENAQHSDLYASDYQDAEYFDALLSSSIGATIAQFIEGVVRYEVESIRYECLITKKNLDTNHRRFMRLGEEDFWDPTKYWDRSCKQVKDNFVLGSNQLFDALRVDGLPASYEARLKVLFFYRNSVMHNGVEWPKNRREGFIRLLERTGSQDKFQWSYVGEQPWMAHMSLEYINELLEFCDHLHSAFVKS